ncbi:MAG: hypothetical protein COS89_05170 [Deltaproteobacteria bacterium CG07_land_8_20_14_0_80_38_7]|nr:MAG: hypothetical protein COS89_05170 [Deltaproteobacteria bacterium CG07_land_8_20_14_0_80_38_7]
MNIYKKLILFVACLLVFVSIAPKSEAGILGDVKAYVLKGSDKINSWWVDKSVNAIEPEEDTSDNSDVTTNDSDNDSEPQANNSSPGMCNVDNGAPDVVCEKGGEFLCVNTPDHGVKEAFVIVKGVAGNDQSSVSSISIAAQNEYTKTTIIVDTSNAESENCWESSLNNKNFCLSEDGFFSAKVSLNEFGPYTISVNASGFSGSSVTKVVRSSRVKRFNLTDDMVTFDPNIRETANVENSHVAVNISLLGDCQNCDFIGSSTSGVTITVDNIMTDEDGHVSTISCVSNVKQGGDGKFVVGVPVAPYSNELKITACNAAVESEGCLVLGGFKFKGTSSSGKFKINTPPAAPSYSSSEYPVIPFEFEFSGSDANECINLTFNRQSPFEVCPDGQGKYLAELNPQVGINMVLLNSEKDNFSYTWVFGWGDISSPFDGGGVVKNNLVSRSALRIVFPAKTISDIIAPLITNVLGSDELTTLIRRFTSGLVSKDQTSDNNEEEIDQQIGDEPKHVAIPLCDEKPSFQGFNFALLDEPILGRAHLDNISFDQNEMSASVGAEDLSIMIGLIKDLNADGKPDADPVPLRLSFKSVSFDFILKIQDNLILLSSPHTDCDFESVQHCKGKPMSLVPQNIVGNATRLGGFVKCDIAGRDVSQEIKDVCSAINTLNNQTGLVNEKVIDAVNSMIYCGASGMLSDVVNNGFKTDFPLSLGDVFGKYKAPLGVILSNADGKASVSIDKKGIFADIGLLVGSKRLFSDMPEELKISSVGVVSSNKPQNGSAPSVSGDLKFDIATDAINHLFFLLTNLNNLDSEHRKALLDIDVSDVFFKELGFDFVEKCDAPLEEEEERSALCSIRPRVSELLGTPLTRYGYFTSNHPLLMKVQANQALPPHLSVVNADEIPVINLQENEDGSSDNEGLGSNLLDLQLGGLMLSFYALELDDTIPPDEYGNRSVKLDKDGNPVIHSMDPSDPDPWKGQISSFALTAFLAVEIGDVIPDPDDLSRLMLKVRPLANRSRLVLSPVPGSNKTTIVPQSLISSLSEKLKLVLNMYSAKGSEFKISIPKMVSFSDIGSDLFELIGLQKIRFAKDGLNLDFRSDEDVVGIDLSGYITQILHYSGQEIVSEYPQ